MTTTPVLTQCCAPEMCPTCTDQGGHELIWHTSPIDHTRFAFAGAGRVKLVELPPVGKDRSPLYLVTLDDQHIASGLDAADVLEHGIAALAGIATPDVEPGTENDDHSADEPLLNCGCPVRIVEDEGHQSGCPKICPATGEPHAFAPHDESPVGPPWVAHCVECGASPSDQAEREPEDFDSSLDAWGDRF